jgi:mannose-6-phosphate isomerase-like protein (cupin superfamily)
MAGNDFSKSLQRPDETRQFKGHGHLDVVSFKDGSSVARGTFEPGWKWSNDVKPIAKTETCQVVHTGTCISGQMTIKMDSGEQFTLRAGDAYHIPAGHDAWVDGKEKCVLIDVGMAGYAKPS